MALTYTPATHNVTKLPDFEAKTIFGEEFSTQELKNLPFVAIVFICAHCPYVQAIEDRLIELSDELQKLGGRLVAICSNDSSEYPEDAPEALRSRAQKKGYNFTYLIDETQNIAKIFGAVCTPDFFVFGLKPNDSIKTLFYRGRLDDNWRDPKKVNRKELLLAVQQFINNQPLAEAIPSMGCSIKWKT